MKRTSKLTALFLAVAVTAAALFLLPRQSQAAVIGIIYPECCDSYEESVDIFKRELAQGGYSSSEAEFYVQKPSSDSMSWSNAFRKFVGVDADLIVIFGDNLLEIACREKTKVPVIFGFVSDPEKAKCIKSLKKPGRNVTGVSGKTSLFTLLEKARLVKPYDKLGVFDLEGDSLAASTVREIEEHQSKLGYRVIPIRAGKRTELGAALLDAPPLDMLLFPNFPIGTAHLAELIGAAKKTNVPIISLTPSDSGVPSILSMYADPKEQGKLMGQMALAILQGGSPSSTSVQTPKKIELEINIGLARQHGLKVPMSIINSATKVNR